MRMTRLEKLFVNRVKQAEGNIKRVRERLQQVDVQRIHDVLELGCGTEAVSAFLADAYEMRVQGTDFDPKQVELARKMRSENDRLRFSVEDATHLSCDDASLDLVVSQSVFHHIPDWERAVREVARVLRPGGYFIWFDLVLAGWVNRVFRPITKNYGLYTAGEVKSAFGQSGFETRFSERTLHGPFMHHHLVLQKT